MAPNRQAEDAVTAAVLRRRLLRWYDHNRRVLPWRVAPGEPADAYRVWISEIMLQQTRVSAVLPYYERFLAAFPDPAALAAAPLEAVLAAWSGLGYYRRARQLHAAAGVVAELHGGVFPPQLEAALALPGVGAYTAAAVLSIAHGQALAAVDGNVARIASRLAGRALSAAETRRMAQAWLPPRRPGDGNQALMDLGALVCLSRAPRCEPCPLRRLCATRGELPPRPRPRPQRIELDYGLARRRGQVFLRQRAADATQLAGLWELPAATPGGEWLATIRHSITTRSIQAHIYSGAPGGSGRWLGPREASALPLTGLTRKALRQILGWEL